MSDVSTFISSFPTEVQSILEQIRVLVKETVPEAQESMSYGIIGYKLNNKPLVYFGAFKKHIGFYATPQGHEAFSGELAHYKQGKGSVQFPLNKEMPYDLMRRITHYKEAQIKGGNRKG